MGGSTGFLIVAVIISIIGFFFLSNVTLGVGLICGGCLLGIIARVRQAEAHHFEITRHLMTINNKKEEL